MSSLVFVRRERDVVSKTMQSVRSNDTSPERLVRRALWRRGLRYRLHRSDLPGKPDIVFPGPKVAVFVDGDFWHGNQWRLRGFRSLEEQFDGRANAEYWIPKIKGNMVRDADVERRLRYDGWKVIRLWESDVLKNVRRCADRIEGVIAKRKAQ